VTTRHVDATFQSAGESMLVEDVTFAPSDRDDTQGFVASEVARPRTHCVFA
jgi:hypothetical protein